MRMDGKVILGYPGKLTHEQLAEIREWWENPAVRAAYLVYEQPAPNRLHGAYINEDGDAV